ncbi:glycosyltransferase [Paramicrobacterium sp. CJ85]|uniref:glycosyltransferase n=1 Tax=Paramicrobacterium sp. CJ85 TaxID=3445355 RepID=UPI003F61AE0A
MVKQHPKVLIWRWGWLARSETFIRSQIDTYEAWIPIALGAERVDSDVARPNDTVLFKGGVWDVLCREFLRVFDWSPRLVRSVKELQVDLIHAHFGGDASRVRGVAKRLNLPFVVTLHGSDVTARPRGKGLRGIRNRCRLKNVLRDADLLIAVSSHIADAAEKLGVEASKIKVLPIGVPWTPAPAEHPRRGVLFVGRFVEKKGVKELLEAYSLLPQHLRDVHPLTLIGDGPQRHELESQAKHLGGTVEFLGFVTPDRVAARLSEAAVFAVPSHTARNGDTEGLPTVVFEAARSATPIVGYSHAGIPEAVENGREGLLVDEHDVSALASNMERVLVDSVLARTLGKAARRRFEAEFTVSECTRVLEHHYGDVLDQKARRSGL